MLAKIKDSKGFMNVFGADCFLEYFPELLTTGVTLKKMSIFSGPFYKENYYVMKDGKPVHDSSFFTEEEMQYLEIISS